MSPVRVARMDAYIMVSGADRSAVERKVAELVSQGARAVTKITPLGRNWVATLEHPTAGPDPDGCCVARLGLQIIVTGPDKVSVLKRAEALMKEGAALKSAPQEHTNGWSAVLDEAGIDRDLSGA